MSHETTRKSLLIRVRDPQDSEAWREFDERYRELIQRFCRAKGVQPADAEDIRQIVLMNLASALRRFQYEPARGRFRSYLARIVLNAISRFRARGAGAKAMEDDLLCDLAGGDDPADEDWEREWVDHHYRRALDTLKKTVEPQSVAVFERLLTGATVEEVAGETELAAPTIYKIRQRMRERLQELVAEQIRDEDESISAA